MFVEGSLFWVLSIYLRYYVFNVICLLGTISVSYAFLRFIPTLSLTERQFQLNKLFYAIVVSYLLILLLSAAYISHQLDWSIVPEISKALKFCLTKYHVVILSIVGIIGLLLNIIIIKVITPLRWSDFGLRKPEVRIWVIIGLVFASIIVIFITSYFWIYLTGLSSSDAQHVSEYLKSLALSWSIFYLTRIVIISPIIEEVFFRGVIFSTLREVMGIKIGLVLQAVLFAFIHGEINAVFPIFVSGLVLAYVYYRTRSILPSIIIHSFQNISVIVISLRLGT